MPAVPALVSTSNTKISRLAAVLPDVPPDVLATAFICVALAAAIF